MAKRPKSAKILIRVDNNLYEFMWVNIGPDDSVMMGFQFEGQQQVELVIDGALGELRPPYIHAPKLVSKPKISFHSSGQYKLDVLMGQHKCAVDRSTVVGPKLRDIIEPRRMAEILLPDALYPARSPPTERDIVLEATTAPALPLICTISCMAEDNFPDIVADGVRVVDTSNWEATNALTSGTHVWAWTLRTSPGHTVYPHRFIIGLLGDVKWGQTGGLRYLTSRWFGRAASAVLCPMVEWARRTARR